MGWHAVIGPERSPSSQQCPWEGCEHEYPSHALARSLNVQHRRTCVPGSRRGLLLAELAGKFVSQIESWQDLGGKWGIGREVYGMWLSIRVGHQGGGRGRMSGWQPDVNTVRTGYRTGYDRDGHQLLADIRGGFIRQLAVLI